MVLVVLVAGTKAANFKYTYIYIYIHIYIIIHMYRTIVDAFKKFYSSLRFELTERDIFSRLSLFHLIAIDLYCNGAL